MKWYFNLIVIYFLRFTIGILYVVLPVKKNRILFSANQSYKCSPKYIFEELYKTYGDKYEYVWVMEDERLIPPCYDVICVRKLSIKHLYYLITSAVIISNVGIEPFLPPRKGRIFINTWHGGGAYKKSSLSASYYSNAHRLYFKIIRNMRAKSTDYIISSNRIFSNVMSDFFYVAPEVMLPIGMPRNDIFFKPDDEKEVIRNRVRKELNIEKDKYIILYAPTYRGHERSAKSVDLGMDVPAVCNAAKRRFGKDVLFLFRCHVNMKGNYTSLDAAVDVSNYSDMQELLLIADMIITDYSSFIWDYSFTYNPGFLYTPDLLDYESDVKFHIPIQQWQYPYVMNMDELCSAILNYDKDTAVQKINEHLSLLGNYEKGTAVQSVCCLIVKLLNEESVSYDFQR